MEVAPTIPGVKHIFTHAAARRAEKDIPVQAADVDREKQLLIEQGYIKDNQLQNVHVDELNKKYSNNIQNNTFQHLETGSVEDKWSPYVKRGWIENPDATDVHRPYIMSQTFTGTETQFDKYKKDFDTAMRKDNITFDKYKTEYTTAVKDDDELFKKYHKEFEEYEAAVVKHKGAYDESLHGKLATFTKKHMPEYEDLPFAIKEAHIPAAEVAKGFTKAAYGEIRERPGELGVTALTFAAVPPVLKGAGLIWKGAGAVAKFPKTTKYAPKILGYGMGTAYAGFTGLEVHRAPTLEAKGAVVGEAAVDLLAMGTGYKAGEQLLKMRVPPGIKTAASKQYRLQQKFMREFMADTSATIAPKKKIIKTTADYQKQWAKESAARDAKIKKGEFTAHQGAGGQIYLTESRLLMETGKIKTGIAHVGHKRKGRLQTRTTTRVKQREATRRGERKARRRRTKRVSIHEEKVGVKEVTTQAQAEGQLSGEIQRILQGQRQRQRQGYKFAYKSLLGTAGVTVLTTKEEQIPDFMQVTTPVQIAATKAVTLEKAAEKAKEKQRYYPVLIAGKKTISKEIFRKKEVPKIREKIRVPKKPKPKIKIPKLPKLLIPLPSKKKKVKKKLVIPTYDKYFRISRISTPEELLGLSTGKKEGKKKQEVVIF